MRWMKNLKGHETILFAELRTTEMTDQIDEDQTVIISATGDSATTLCTDCPWRGFGTEPEGVEHAAAVSQAENERLREALRSERNNARALVGELRHIAQNCDHTADGEHIHEPTTGGSLHCGPCYAWRVLNGSPDAGLSGSDERG